jgi:hypothetical protein
MNWADRKIEAYKQGEEANFLERIMVGYMNPVTYSLLIIGGLLFVIGLWSRNMAGIIFGGFSSFLAGNIYSQASGWADKRIRDYASGAREPSWVEKRGLEEAHPVSFSLRSIAGVFFVKGLWDRNWSSIGIGLLLGMIGRLIPAIK